MDQKQYLTQQKYDELKNELDFLISTRRAEIAEEIERARSFGDLSENAEYQQAKTAQGELESRIQYLIELLKTAQIIAPHKADRVEVGSTVTVQRKKEKETRTYQIVGSEEADTAAGRISLNSPLGQAMMGKREGDTFAFMSPVGKEITYTIINLA